MSGHAEYKDIDNPTLRPPHNVPLYIANQDNTLDYGRFVNDFDHEEVWITTWPAKGWRPVCSGTGNEGGITGGDFKCRWDGDLALAFNKAVGGDYIIGRLPSNVSPSNRTHVLTREANYHPDGGQVFFPANKNAFILVLALPNDDVKPEDFKAFYFDGTQGFQIKADIWHQALYSLDDEATFTGKQGKVHACILMDSVDEFRRFMKIPLKPEFAENYKQVID